MKILVISQYYYPEPFRITDICESLSKRGHSITVLTAQPNYPEGTIYQAYVNKFSNEIINGIKVIRAKIHPRGKNSINLFLNYISFPYYANHLVKRLDNDFDVVFINQLSPVLSALPGIKYGRKYNKKIVLYCLDLWPESLASGGIKENSFVYKLFTKISKSIYKKANLIAVSSKSFEIKFDYIKKNIIYLPQYAEDIFDYKESVKTKNGKFNLVFAGNIGEMQSIETIVYSANELKLHEDIIFNIYGTGSKFDDIKTLINRLGLKNIFLHGRKDISEMPMIYREADALLVTLKKNQFTSMTLPGKVQTYMSAAKPIIAAIDGETHLIIEESNAGYVCEAENYMALSTIIIEARNNVNLHFLGQNGKKYYDSNFSKTNFLSKLELLLMEVQNV